MDVIVGLGNPGQRYHQSRHNIGFDVVDMLASKHGISLQQQSCSALCGTGYLGHRAILLAKPQTYMNASGEAVAALVQRYLDAQDQFMVIHDDIDLPLGKIQLKRQGGDAGHRGVRSIMQHLQTGEFMRLRLGVGRPALQEDIIHYVLSPFAAEELAIYRLMLAQAVAQVEALLEC